MHFGIRNFGLQIKAGLLALVITGLTFLLLPLIGSIPEKPEREAVVGFTRIAEFAESVSEPTEELQARRDFSELESLPEPPPPVVPEPLEWTPPPPVSEPLVSTTPDPEPEPVSQPEDTHKVDPLEVVAPAETNTAPDGLAAHDKDPGIVHRPRPKYPRMAKYRGIEGYVDVRLRVTSGGAVETIEILDSKPRGIFDDSVRRTVRDWRFTPATREGRAVESVVETRILFELR